MTGLAEQFGSDGGLFASDQLVDRFAATVPESHRPGSGDGFRLMGLWGRRLGLGRRRPPRPRRAGLLIDLQASQVADVATCR